MKINFKQMVLAGALGLVFSGCGVSVSGGGAGAGGVVGKPKGGSESSGTRFGSREKISDLKEGDQLRSLLNAWPDGFLADGYPLSYQRVVEIDMGLTRGEFHCNFNVSTSSSGKTALVVDKVSVSSYIPTPSRYGSGVIVTFKDGSKVSIFNVSMSTSLSTVQEKCLGTWAEFRKM